MAFKYEGTVIAGTHDPKSLIEAFLSVIEDLKPELAYKIKGEYAFTLKKVEENNPAFNSSVLEFLMNDLFQAMDECAPINYYFGAHEGDGADFGFWQCEGVQPDPVMAELVSEVAAIDYSEEADIKGLKSSVSTNLVGNLQGVGGEYVIHHVVSESEDGYTCYLSGFGPASGAGMIEQPTYWFKTFNEAVIYALYRIEEEMRANTGGKVKYTIFRTLELALGNKDRRQFDPKSMKPMPT